MEIRCPVTYNQGTQNYICQSMNCILIGAYDKNSKAKEYLWVFGTENSQKPERTILPLKNSYWRASLVAQWIRIYLPMQGTQVRSLVQEDPTCCGATKPVRHNC